MREDDTRYQTRLRARTRRAWRRPPRACISTRPCWTRCANAGRGAAPSLPCTWARAPSSPCAWTTSPITSCTRSGTPCRRPRREADRPSDGRAAAASSRWAPPARARWNRRPREHLPLRATQGDTRLFITPGYRFKALDALITNFHLPQSTLLMMVVGAGGHGTHAPCLCPRRGARATASSATATPCSSKRPRPRHHDRTRFPTASPPTAPRGADA